jgi:NAD-dependent dihydropyrimidine dehydrogenase PreA subunit
VPSLDAAKGRPMLRFLTVLFLSAVLVRCGPRASEPPDGEPSPTGDVVSCIPGEVLGQPTSALATCGEVCFRFTRSDGSSEYEEWTFCPATGPCERDCPGGVVFFVRDGVVLAWSSDNPNP